MVNIIVEKFRAWFLGISAVLAIALFVYVLMNFPAITKRVFGVRNEGFSSDVVKASTISGVDGGMIWGETGFEDIFIDANTRKIYQNYFGKYQNSFLVIPAIQVEAPIVMSDSSDENVLQEKLKQGVAHYPDTAVPGEKGNVFIFGHSSYYWWDWSKYSDVFANLEQIKNGDEILAYYNNELYIYEVKETKIVSPTDLSVLDQGSGYDLTLMTCTPLGTTLNRFIVVAELKN